MNKIVVDSSVIVKWLHQENENYTLQADVILNNAQEQNIKLLSSFLAMYEAGNALLKKSLSTSKAKVLLTVLYKLPVNYMPETQELAFETYKIAKSARDKGYKKVTYYDAAFMALAKLENATLVTDNPKHQAKVKGVKVVALKDYK